MWARCAGIPEAQLHRIDRGAKMAEEPPPDLSFEVFEDEIDPAAGGDGEDGRARETHLVGTLSKGKMIGLLRKTITYQESRIPKKAYSIAKESFPRDGDQAPGTGVRVGVL